MTSAHAATVECVKVLSADGNIIHINPGGLCLFEVDSEHILDGRHYVDLWPQDTRARVSQAIAAALQGASSILEGYCPTFRGSPRWWVTTFYLDTLRAVRQPVVIGVSRDISPQRCELLARRAARERFAATAETSSDGVLAVGPDGICTYCNTAGASLLGYHAAELIGRPLDAVIHRRGGGRQGEIAGVSPIVYATRSSLPSQFEYERLTHRQGYVIWVSCVVYPCSPAADWCACVLTFAPTPHRDDDSPHVIFSMQKPALLSEMEATLIKLDERAG